MKTYTVTFTENQFLLLRDMLSTRVDYLTDKDYQRYFTVPEILNYQILNKVFRSSQPNERKEIESNGEEKEVS